MDYIVTTNGCNNVAVIPSCFTGSIKIATTIPNGTIVQVTITIDGRMDVHNVTVSGGYVSFVPNVTIYSIPFMVQVGSEYYYIRPEPNYGEYIDNVIIN
jgi:hypothetical protein